MFLSGVIMGRNILASRWKELPEEDIWYPSSRMRKRIKFDASARVRAEKAGKKVIVLQGADVNKWGFINPAMLEIMIQTVKEQAKIDKYQKWEEFRERARNYEKEYRGVDYSLEDVTITAGVGGGLRIIHDFILDPGDEIVAPDPSFYQWAPRSQMRFFKSKAIGFRIDETIEWKPDLEDFRAKISPKTKAIYIDHPGNPTGAVYDVKTLRGIVDIAGEYDLPIIADEIYGVMTYDGIEAKTFASIARDVPVIMLNSTAKFFMRPGWHLGWMCFHDPQGKIAELKKLVNEIGPVHGFYLRKIPTIILIAGCEIFQFVEEGREMMKQLQTRRDFFWKRLNEIEGASCTKPMGTIYAFPRIEGIGKIWKTTEDFMIELFEEEAITFLPGPAFGKLGFGHFRTLLLPPIEVQEEVYGRLERFLKRHQA